MPSSRLVVVLRRLPWLAACLAIAAGCTRAFFRERADQDVEGLLEQKSIDPRWNVEGWYVYPDQRARFADFGHKDRPKKPPDDPAAAALAPDPQPLRSKFWSGPEQDGDGYLEFLKHCDQYNRTARGQIADDNRPAATLGSPNRPASYSPTADAARAAERSLDRALHTDEQPFLITLDQATELSLFNSREFQDRREDLYLAALPVTLQRFAFVTQFFAGIQAVRDWNASNVPGGPGSRWSINTTGSASQLFPSGAAAVVQLANRLAIDLGTSNPTIGLSNLTLSVTQPLLQGGGWAVTLEPLTQAERSLVYGVRSYARFRGIYYVYIAGGTDLGNSVFGFNGLFAGGGAGISAPSQGYLPTLLTAALERNERENLTALTSYFEMYREYQGRGDLAELQVGQVEQQILRSQTTLLQRRQDLQGGLDQFKLQLGVPTQLPIELDDGPARPVKDMLAEFTRARDEFASLRTQADQFRNKYRGPLQLLAGAAVGAIQLEAPLRELIQNLLLESAYARRAQRFRASIPERWDRWKALSPDQAKEKLRAQADELRDLEVRQAKKEAVGERLPPAETARLEALPRDMAIGQLESSLRSYESARTRKDSTPRDTAVLYEETVNNLIRVMSEAREERRALVRADWPKLPAVTVEGEDLLTADLDRAQTVAAQAALANRLDLMNARGRTVDAWRRIGVTANSLLGVLNVGYNFDTPSPPNANQPFALGGARSHHQLVLTGELPLVRRAERNEYRTALIGYQRARRNLQATEDFILNDVRVDLRSLRVLAENYRIQQRAVEVAYDQVENSLDILQAPPQPDAAVAGRPGQAGAQGQQQAASAAALTQQLLTAQTGLVAAQNLLYSVWVQYLIARMTFFRDIERLPLDPRGVWIDEPSTSPPAAADVFPPPGPVGAADTGRFAEIRTAGDR